MAQKNKKLAAALAAVNAYIMQEEEAAYQAQLAAARSAAQAGPSLWAIAGRQDIMNFRRLIQMKAF
ncbi:hypothetical protein [Desulfobulbus oligotrophicus]|jgi:hypothetical protein|uniref:Uncharacterized protein n=1 Tax=Desulfobulbus oligotrophicus TaxID=1909699 RepID=A0A7T5VFJ2_9BACT|nr:hypothetical protein [Desulfobulbus oligotrophicus]MDY0389874.1 hypothetical protein [Desulfobulbus oligotrophicus]QQG66864.1 hypothetical protein HP555_13810 [Desulfobulbus oligotrophicus]